ncbi:histidine kinase [Chthoniobacter flavus Ellin428]|uniref:Oxygen sensor histidine kinase NreB n=1 Tax=Chthoniobacter flavus Ellin428 TaxID=497964 RepID=B4D9V3_9BACT|nr:sensor histidine kinase [Chthoniobacter flavus]EDY16767.1 histidine kinase [Chthoniobacter flavus Ellin428]
MLPRAILFLVALLLPALAHSEPAWLVRAWQSDDGLPNNDVTCLAQAPDGAMLFATRGGLARFDGWRFRDVPMNVSGHGGSGVNAVLPARDGTRWLVARAVVVRQHPGQPDQVMEMPVLDVGGSRETAFFEDTHGVVWLCYEGGRFHRIEKGHIEQVPVAPGLAPTFASCATLDARGDVWASGPRVLARWREGRFEKVATLPNDRSALCSATTGGLWIGAGKKLLHYTETGGVAEAGELTATPAGARITTLREDRHGRLWLGTFGGGLWLRTPDGFQPVPLPNADVWWLEEDREGNIWAATAGGGACRIRPRVLTTFDEPGGPHDEAARALCTDARGDLWVATQNARLFVRRDGAWRLLAPGSDWPGAKAVRVTAGLNGNVWIANGDGNLVRWDGNAFEPLPLPPDKAKPSIFALLEASDGELWVARGFNVWRGRPGNWRDIPMPAESGAAQVLVQDTQGHIWAGTVGGFLLREENGRFVRVAEEELGPACNGIRALLVAPDGALLIGTQGTGIARWSGGHCRLITRDQGLPHNVISQLAFDTQGRLWAGSDAGIFMAPLDQLVAVAEGRAPTLQVTVFGRSEGVSGLQANASFPGTLRDAEGRLWFATRNGIVIADPGVVGGNRVPPPVAIETMRVNGALMPPTAEIGPGVRQLEFELSAFSFTAPENVRLFHRLDGLDTDWVATPPQRTADYAHLPPGDYTLRVRAENNDGIPSEHEARLAFAVRPFLWQTAWFRYGLAAAALGAAAFLAHLAAERRSQRQAEALRREAAIERERARIARDMHDQLGTSLTRISLLSDLAQSENHSRHLPQLVATAHEAVTALDEIVWAVNPRHDTLASLLEYLGQQTSETLQAAGIRCRLEFPDHPAPRALSADFRHHLFLIVREAVNNAVKHARATEVRLTVEPHPAGLHLMIADDGRGFDQNGTIGNGLANLRERTTDLGGTCQITSTPGSGTTLALRLPWPPEHPQPPL